MHNLDGVVWYTVVDRCHGSEVFPQNRGITFSVIDSF